MAIANDIRSIDPGLSARVSGFFGTLRESRQRRKVYLETLRELRSLSDSDLADLGMQHSSLARIAAEAAYGK